MWVSFHSAIPSPSKTNLWGWHHQAGRKLMGCWAFQIGPFISFPTGPSILYGFYMMPWFFFCILRHIWILNAFDTKVIVWACFEEGWHVGWPVVLVSMCSSFRQNLTADDDPIMTCLIMFASFRTFSDRTHLNSQNSSHSPRLGWMENLQEAKDEISRFEAKTMIPSRFFPSVHWHPVLL